MCYGYNTYKFRSRFSQYDSKNNKVAVDKGG